MSNLTELIDNLNKIGTNQFNSVSTAGSAIGFAADLGGGVGAVLAVIGLLENKDSDIGVALQGILAAIEQVIAEQHAQNILSRLRAIDEQIANAETTLQLLPGFLAQVPPPSQEVRDAQISACTTALNNLIRSDQWQTVFLDETYYQDDRVGVISPQQTASGLVFTTRYVLPQCLRAVYILLVVTIGYEGSTDTISKPLSECATALRTYHDQASAGIAGTALMPKRDEIWAFASVGGGDYLVDENGFLESPWSYGMNLLEWDSAGGVGTPVPDPDGGYQWYGAVDRHTGFSSLGSYPGILPPGSARPDEQFFAQFEAKLRLATLKRWKDVYSGLGLPALWQTIGLLCDATQTPRPQGVDRSFWSLRELAQTLGPVHLPHNPNTINASATLGTLTELRGHDQAARPLSMREQLDALPYPDAGVQPI
jgi:hypothetical protein